jgi:diguanylate cyclase (GGDEF)-like protein
LKPVLAEGEAGLPRLREAVVVLARSPARLEHAHALVALGCAERRASHAEAAADRLRRALRAAPEQAAGEGAPAMRRQRGGYPEEEILGRTPAELHGELGVQAEVLYRQVLHAGVPIAGMEVSGSTSSEPDRERHWSLHYFPVRKDGDIAGLCVVVLEVTDRVELERRLAHRATHDVLTKLPGRELFLDRLAQAMERLKRHPGRILVVFGDVDRLKDTNDRLGHAAGDALIAAVATRLRSAVRSEDTVGRWGGDDFVLLLENVSDEREARLLLERARKAVAMPLELEGEQIEPRITLGVAVTEDYERPEHIVGRADADMYREEPS